MTQLRAAQWYCYRDWPTQTALSSRNPFEEKRNEEACSRGRWYRAAGHRRLQRQQDGGHHRSRYDRNDAASNGAGDTACNRTGNAACYGSGKAAAIAQSRSRIRSELRKAGFPIRPFVRQIA
ncbi:hypothetical protein GCM10007937_05860 [Mesorhizobium albiziae]|nr:hypothetical protein GCM10007937_05860 [Mesorhizobium albiziae]